ncbi:MAG: hypothetical protein WCE53_01575 [Candidatus Acidiferrum sp.]
MTDVAPRSQPRGNPHLLVIRSLLIRAAAVCALLWVALFNGYPIVFSDTASYLLTGLTFIAFWPFRSPGYSIFTKLASLGISAWLVIGVQAIIVVYVLDKTCEYLIGNERRYRDICLLASVSILAALTSLPWLVSQLMPDVFAGIVFLSSFLLAFNDQLPWKSRMSLAAILMISTAAHTSLLPIAACFVTLLIIIKLVARLRRAATLRGAVLASLIVPLIAGGLSTATLNYRMHLGFRFSPSGQLFMLSRLFADGLAADFLRENCPKQPLIACSYLSQLPHTQTEFLFENHPLLWEMIGHQGEMDEIVHGTLATHKLGFLTSSIKETLLQFAAFRTGDEVRSYQAKEWNRAVVAQVFPRDFRAFLSSKETRGHLLPLANAAVAIDTVAFWLSVVICLAFSCIKPMGRLNQFFYSAMAFLLINAAVCATFSGVFDRYQSRVAWLAALCATTYICSWFKDRHRAENLSQEP